MSGYINDFMTLLPGKGMITIIGGIQLPIQGVRTIRLRYHLPDDSNQIAELTNALYSSELYSTRLFS